MHSLSTPHTRKIRAITLIEIMVVVVIIGMISTAGTLAVMKQFREAQKRTARNAVNGPLSHAFETYYLDNKEYPSSEQGFKALIDKADAHLTNWSGPYLTPAAVPVDPWGMPYEYKYPSERQYIDFAVWSTGPDRICGNQDDIGNWPG